MAARHFDRLLRSDVSAEEKWQYLRENRVRAGLVTRWEVALQAGLNHCRRALRLPFSPLRRLADLNKIGFMLALNPSNPSGRIGPNSV